MRRAHPREVPGPLFSPVAQAGIPGAGQLGRLSNHGNQSEFPVSLDHRDSNQRWNQSSSNQLLSYVSPSNSSSKGSGNSSDEGDNNGDSDSDNGDSNNGGSNNKNFCPFCIADNDPRVMYIGPWVLNGSGFLATTHSTVTPGSSVSLTFNGTGITVFGTVPLSNDTFKPPTVAYSIDAAPAYETTEPRANQAISNQPLYASSQLSSTEEHRLVVNVKSAETPFILDYFFLIPVSSPKQNVASGPSHTSVPVASATSNSTSSGSSTKGNSSTIESHRVVYIVLGALGGLIVVLLVIFICLFWRRKQRKLQPEDAPSTPSTSKYIRETIFTSTESMFRNHPNWSMYTRSSRFRSDLNTFVPIPSPPPVLPPKMIGFLSAPQLSDQRRISV